jgi:cell division protein FtsL
MEKTRAKKVVVFVSVAIVLIAAGISIYFAFRTGKPNTENVTHEFEMLTQNESLNDVDRFISISLVAEKDIKDSANILSIENQNNEVPECLIEKISDTLYFTSTIGWLHHRRYI